MIGRSLIVASLIFSVGIALAEYGGPAVTQAQLSAAVQAEATRAQAAETAILSPSQIAALAPVQSVNGGTGIVSLTIPTNAQMAAAAPVQSVNTKVGTVTVPTICRQFSNSTAIPVTSSSSITWTFPNTSCSFSGTPTCFAEISSTSTTTYFDFPTVSNKTTSAVTMSFTAHAATLSIASVLTLPLTLNVTVNPPSSAYAVLSCVGPSN